MKRMFRRLQALLPAVCAASGILVTGCAGPSTRVLPRENHREYYEQAEASLLLEEANPFYMQETLGILTASHRPGGSKGETEAARMLQQFLQDYGYKVTRQRFRLWDGNLKNEVTGTNVVAVREAYAEDADILIVSTHHDTAEGSPGAGNNASGVVTWLETARLVSRLPSDTEIRFVSFSGVEDGWMGSRYYVESLSENEKKRIIGAIQLDAYGSVEFPEVVLGTSDGNATMLGDMIRQSFWEVLGETLRYEIREGSDAISFVSGQIPAVSLVQRRESYELDSPLDIAETVDIERIARVTDCVTDMVAQVMSSDTPSMLAKSRYMNDLRDTVFTQQKRYILAFGKTRRELEGFMRQEGVLISSHTDEDERVLEGYQYPMKWFDVDQVILTNYYFTDGLLDSVTLDADGAGVDLDDMIERLSSWYGTPEEIDGGPYGTEYVWSVPSIHLRAVLTQTSDGFDVELKKFQGETVFLDAYQPGGTRLSEEIKDKRSPLVMAKVKKMIPDTMKDRIRRITFYTDGVGSTKGNVIPYSSEEETEQKIPAEILIDLDDAMDENGIWRNETASEKLFLRLIGEVLELDGADGAVEQFRREFPVHQEEMDDVQTDMRPGEEAESETILPDFEESFMYFVLTDQTDDRPGEWSQRIGFFYDQPDLVSMRREIRARLGLHGGVNREDS